MEDVRLGIIRRFICFSILFLFVGGAAHGEGLYTRTDELACGNALVQTFTTCTEDSETPVFAACVEQHFLFLNQTTGSTVRVEASGDPFVDQHSYQARSEMWLKQRFGIWLNGLAVDWACLQGKAGPYVVIGYIIGDCRACGFDDVFDVNGRKVASSKNADTDDEKTAYENKWHSLGLPEPWPWDPFVSIQLFKEDRKRLDDESDEDSGSTGPSSRPKPGGKVKRLVFSPSEHRHEREMVMKSTYMTRKRLGNGKIYIALTDLKDHGTREIFAYFDRWDFCGRMGCETYFYRVEKQKLVPLMVFGDLQIFLDIDRKGYQTVFGILPSKTMGWHDIILDDGTVWKWTGKGYDAVHTKEGR